MDEELKQQTDALKELQDNRVMNFVIGYFVVVGITLGALAIAMKWIF